MGIPSWARVGAKVVRVIGNNFAGGIQPGTENDPAPKVGEVVTIVAVDPFEGVQVSAYLVLAEYPGSIYAIEIFRPLVTRSQEQDIAAIKRLLTDMPEEIDA